MNSEYKQSLTFHSLGVCEIVPVRILVPLVVPDELGHPLLVPHTVQPLYVHDCPLALLQTVGLANVLRHSGNTVEATAVTQPGLVMKWRF